MRKLTQFVLTALIGLQILATIVFVHPKNYVDQLALERSVKVVSVGSGEAPNGTGTLLGGGFILTAAHIFEDNHGTPMIMRYGSNVFEEATMVAFDPKKDVALLLVKNKNDKEVMMTTKYRQGDRITFVGNGQGGDFEIGHSNIIATAYISYGERLTPIIIFPCDTGKPGFSGGGLFDTNGDLIGVFEMSFPNGKCGAIRMRELIKEAIQ